MFSDRDSVSSDPLPPPSLTVSATATTSVTVTWTYNSSKSLTTQWRVNCKTVDGIAVSDTTTDSVNPKELTINRLIPGMSYTVSVFGVTNGINSLTKTHIDTTTSKYIMPVPYYNNRNILEIYIIRSNLSKSENGLA